MATIKKGSRFSMEQKVSGKGVALDQVDVQPPAETIEPLLYAKTEKYTPDLTTYGIKLGWIQGVLIPCLLNIWGVMLFLRIAWVVAEAGTGYSILIIGLSSTVCVLTTLSLSAICSNGQLKGGGVYYIVSRSLGAGFGAAVGIIFAFANAVAASMNTIGFCESLNELLKNHGIKIIDNAHNDTRIVGTCVLFIMCVICAIGMDWEVKTQNFLITVIVLAITNYVLGACIGPLRDSQRAMGFVGINSVTAATNWKPDFRFSEGVQHNFFSVFAIFFPAVTGVQAGANICGDLRDPSKAIPKGTLMALLISGISYFTMSVLCGVAALRDASGSYKDFVEGNIAGCAPNCTYGMHNHYEIMNLMSLWGPLIYGGCWAATLSTALTNILSVPRLVQALGTDRIYPGLIFFSKPYGRHGEPYRGYVLVFSVSLLFLLIADLNRIAPLITNFYLASYALINFCTFHASFVYHLSWRPTFKYFNTWLSLIGFILCVIIMIIISWIMALVTLFMFFALYLVVHYREPDVNWGGSTEAQIYRQTVNQVLQMSKKEEPTKMFCPHPLVLTGDPYKQVQLLDIANDITDAGAFMIVANIKKEKLDKEVKNMEHRVGEAFLGTRNCRGFYVILDNSNIIDGVRSLINVAGLGRLAPNTIIVGYKADWRSAMEEDRSRYCDVLRMAFEEQMSICIFRKDINQIDPALEEGLEKLRKRVSAQPCPLSSSVMHTDSEEEFGEMSNILTKESVLQEIEFQLEEAKTAEITQAIPTINKHKMIETVDAWWLYDDGGLNILIPYIVSRRHRPRRPLRIFAVTKNKIEDGRQKLERILKKFRIDYDKLTMLTEARTKPSLSSCNAFNAMMDKVAPKQNPLNAELDKIMTMKTYRHIRIKELMVQHSSKAELIVLTLPFPRKNVAAVLYLAWLEMLSSNLPPVLFVRGTQKPVLES